MEHALPRDLTFASFQLFPTAGARLDQNMKLYQAQMLDSAGGDEKGTKQLLMFNPWEMVVRVAAEIGLFNCIITLPKGDAALPDPVGRHVGDVWITRAVLENKDTTPAIGTLPTIKQWSEDGKWVEPSVKLMALANKYWHGDDKGEGLWQEKGCYLRGDQTWKNAAAYDSNVDQYALKAIVTTGTGASKLWWRSKVAGNDIAPSNVNAALVAEKWEWGKTESQMCEMFNASASSILNALAEFAEKELGATVTEQDIIAAVDARVQAAKATGAEVLAGTKDDKWVSPSTLTQKLATESEVLNAATATAPVAEKLVTVENIEQLKATAAEAVDPKDTKHFMTPATTDVAIDKVVNAGIDTWQQGDSHLNGNGLVLGSDGKWYWANPLGDPANNDPTVAANRPTHWKGPYEGPMDALAAAVPAAPAAAITGKNIAAGEIILTDSNGASFNLLDVLRKAICDADPIPVGDTVLYDGAPAGRVNVPYLRGEGILIITCSWNYQKDLATLILPIINGFPGQYEFTDQAEPFGPTGLVEQFAADFFAIVPREYYPHNAQVPDVGENGFITKIVYRRITPNPMCMALSPKPALSSFMATKSADPGPAGTPPVPPCAEATLWSGSINADKVIPLSASISRFGRIGVRITSGGDNVNAFSYAAASVGSSYLGSIGNSSADTVHWSITGDTQVTIHSRGGDWGDNAVVEVKGFCDSSVPPSTNPTPVARSAFWSGWQSVQASNSTVAISGSGGLLTSDTLYVYIDRDPNVQPEGEEWWTVATSGYFVAGQVYDAVGPESAGKVRIVSDNTVNVWRNGWDLGVARIDKEFAAR